MAREQPLPHLDPPKIKPRPLSQAQDSAGLLGYAASNNDLTRFLSYAIAILYAFRPWLYGARTKVNPTLDQVHPAGNGGGTYAHD